MATVEGDVCEAIEAAALTALAPSVSDSDGITTMLGHTS